MPKFKSTRINKWIAGPSIAVLAGSIYLLSVFPVTSKSLPFPDGLYVTDQKYCSYDDSQILNMGDLAALHFLSLNGAELYNHYESTCTIQRVEPIGSSIHFTSLCNAEGETYEVPMEFLQISDTTFERNGEAFTLCEPDFSSGLTNTQIEKMQTGLLDLGFNPGKPDGKIGPKTLRAMRSFQRQFGQTETHQLDEVTFERILAQGNSGSSSAEPKQVEKLTDIEPSSGVDNTIEHSDGQPKASKEGDVSEEEIQRFLAASALAEKLRGNLIANPDEFVSVLTSDKAKEFSNILSKKQTVARLLDSSVAFIGCQESPLTVVGFYNVSQNIWAIFWLTNEALLVKGRLSTGFSPIDEPDRVGWYELRDPDGPIFEAMDQAFKIQERAFALLFNNDWCAAQKDDIYGSFTDFTAAGIISTNETMMDGVDKTHLIEAKQNIRKKYNVPENVELALSLAIPTSNFDGSDYLTFHTAVGNRLGMVITLWELTDGELKEVEGTVGIIGDHENE